MRFRTNEPVWPALLRTGTAVILLASFVSLWPDYDLLFGADGLADRALFRLQHPGFFTHAALQPDAPWVRIAYVISCLLLARGLCVRAAAAMLLGLQYLIFTGSYEGFSYGFDYIASSCLFYCLLFCGRPAAGRGKDIGRWFLRVHVCIIYFFAGLGKLLGTSWHNGEALWKAVVQPGFESIFKPDLHALGAYPALWIAGGWVVLLLEITYPFFIWPRHTRRAVLWAIIGLHIAIALLMGLYFFSALMILLNLAAFHAPDIPTDKPSDASIHVQPNPAPASSSETHARAAARLSAPGGSIRSPPSVSL